MTKIKIVSCNCKFKKTFVDDGKGNISANVITDKYNLDGISNTTYKKLTHCPVCGKKIEIDASKYLKRRYKK